MNVDPTTWKLEGDFVPRECTPVEPNGDLQLALNLKAIQYAKALNLPLLMTLDSHMINPESKFIQDILLQNGNPDGWRFSETYSMKNAEEAFEAWGEMGLSGYVREFNEAVDNNQVFVDMIDNDINFPSKFHMPLVSVSREVREEFPNDEVEQHVQEIINRIREFNVIPLDDERYTERIEQEIEVIGYNGTLNFLPYFIFVSDICKEARDLGDLVGPGRGSAAGSLLCYALKITHIDPIKYNLSFARFLSFGRIARKKFPDIDIDFGDPNAVADRLKMKYGDLIARICTVTTVKVRNAIKDVSRILTPNLSPDDMNKITKKIGIIPQGVDPNNWLYGYTDSDGNTVPGELDTNETLKEYFARYPDVEKSVKKILGIPRSIGRHASAFCISEVPIKEIIPICNVNEQECTQFTKDPVEALGLIKIDLLGLNTLKDIGEAIRWIEKVRGVKIDFYNIPTEGPLAERAWRAFHQGSNETVFQFNSSIGVDLSKRIKPSCIEDLAQMTAAGRPGTLDALMPDGVVTLFDQWVKYRTGAAGMASIHPSVDDILESTGGACLFQEQISSMFQQACDYSEEEADEIREIIGKKKHDLMNQRIPEITQKLRDKMWSEKSINSFISLCIASANYSFNKSHAISYATIGYCCQFLKTNYPLEWWTAVLQNSSLDDMAKTSKSCSAFVSSPDINKSDLDFFIASAKNGSDRGRIIYPLSQIKSIKNCAKFIVDLRPFSSFEDFYKRVNKSKVNKRVLTQLIFSGAFDDLCSVKTIEDRNLIYAEYLRLRGEFDEATFRPFNKLDLMCHQHDAIPLWVPDYVEHINQIVNTFVVKEPSALYNVICESKKSWGGPTLIIGGRISKKKDHVTKNNEPMCFITLINTTTEAEVVCFSDSLKTLTGSETPGKLEVGDVVYVHGKVNEHNDKKSLVANSIRLFRRDVDYFN